LRGGWVRRINDPIPVSFYSYEKALQPFALFDIDGETRPAGGGVSRAGRRFRASGAFILRRKTMSEETPKK
jgi:hypothetical protein